MKNNNYSSKAIQSEGVFDSESDSRRQNLKVDQRSDRTIRVVKSQKASINQKDRENLKKLLVKSNILEKDDILTDERIEKITSLKIDNQLFGDRKLYLLTCRPSYYHS